MTPTMELRFVEREVPYTFNTTKTIRILQQKWVSEGCIPYKTAVRVEWRDVPLSSEEQIQPKTAEKTAIRSDGVKTFEVDYDPPEPDTGFALLGGP